MKYSYSYILKMVLVNMIPLRLIELLVDGCSNILVKVIRKYCSRSQEALEACIKLEEAKRKKDNAKARYQEWKV